MKEIASKTIMIAGGGRMEEDLQNLWKENLILR